jgi:hypothetical protein
MHNLREEQIKMREEFNRLEHRFEVILGRMGRRWGVDLEKTMLGTFKEVLEKEGIEIGKVESLSYTDYDGSITGLKGRRVQVDILVKKWQAHFDRGKVLSRIRGRGPPKGRRGLCRKDT